MSAGSGRNNGLGVRRAPQRPNRRTVPDVTNGAGRRGSGSARGESGANLVEFAFVMPLLTLFLFGIVQFGIAYDKQQSINSAAREGARLAALDTTTLEDIGERAVQAYDASAAPGQDPTVEVQDEGGNQHGLRQPDGTYSVSKNDPTIMPCGEDPASSEFVRVLVSTPYDITIPFFGVHSVTISAEAEFRCE